MRRSLFIAGIISMLMILPELAQSEEDYQIIERKDLSYRSPSSDIMIKRLSYRIKVEPPITKEKLHSICNKILSTQSSDIKATSFLFYLPDTEVDGQYTAGKAEWAPNGSWQDAESPDPCRLEVVLAKIPSYQKSSLSVSEKKKIFYALVVAQDSGIGDDQAYHIIAEKYGLSMKEARNISVEGVVNNWPMP